MIVKILFKINGEPEIMLFGNSYKTWDEQFREFFQIWKNKSRGNAEIIKAWKCKDKWKGWGGLKWCSEADFQEELNREGCQQGDPDNPNPRKYNDMIFTEFNIEKFKHNV